MFFEKVVRPPKGGEGAVPFPARISVKRSHRVITDLGIGKEGIEK